MTTVTFRACFLFIVFAAAAWQTQGLKILGIFPMAARSHYILGRRLMIELANRGHEVTVINPFGEKNAPKTYKDVLLTGFLEQKEEENMNLFEFTKINTFMMMFFMNMMGNRISEITLAHENVQKLLKSNEKFDVVIVEQFVDDALKGFCHHYKAPCVILSTIGSNAWVNHLVGNPAPTSYVPDLFLSYTGHMTFTERLMNTIVSIYGYLNRVFLFMPKQNQILKKYFPDAPHLDVLNNNVSLILLNSHVSTNQPVPHVPNMIEIGGYHLDPPKELPKEWKDFLDSAKEGVVYFSMGSNLKSKDLPKEKRDDILKTFSKLKQKVLWKFEGDLPGQSPNVKVGKWLPQQEILAHPNVKVFITHGGLLSTTEAIYHGKPIIAIPIFGDQMLNANAAQSNGFGLMLPYNELNEEKLTFALNELLNNPKYAQNAKGRSKLMHDQPIKPIDSAVYWVEYAVRHKGSSHFRSAAVDLYWYQYYLLDVLAFIAAVTGAVLLALCVIVKKLFGSKKNKKEADKKKKKL